MRARTLRWRSRSLRRARGRKPRAISSKRIDWRRIWYLRRRNVDRPRQVRRRPVSWLWRDSHRISERITAVEVLVQRNRRTCGLRRADDLRRTAHEQVLARDHWLRRRRL